MPVPSAIRRLPASADETRQCGGATFVLRQLDPVRVFVTATGDIDARNRQALGRFVERHTRIAGQLILDLTDVEQFGRHGFTALYYVSVHCARREVDWMLVGSRTVRQDLSVFDPESELPLVKDYDHAVSKLDHLARCRHAVS